MSGGMVNPAQGISYVCASAVRYAGTLIAAATSGNTVDICGAGAEPIGFAFTNNDDPVLKTARTNEQVTVCALIPGQIIEVPLLATNDTITYGDALETATGGTVDKKSGAAYVVGNAIAAAASNAGGYIKLRVNKYYASA